MTEQYDEIHGLSSPGEFSSFQEWLNSMISNGGLREVPVQSRYGDMENFEERWFLDSLGVVWRLVSPQPPFMGVFLPVPLPQHKMGWWAKPAPEGGPQFHP
ncbi:hypothetical protein [Nonomuraea sp. NPDC049400]|uniref:hypothetical protein n=1 Tax=Nonomuraea sp. NPDC049400 TaxID=3364352 RepID=UPI0037AE05B8